MMDGVLQPGDEEILAMCASEDEGDGTAPVHSAGDNGFSSGGGLDLSDLSANPFHFNMVNSTVKAENSHVQFGPTIIASSPGFGSTGTPHINLEDENNDSVDLSPGPKPGINININSSRGNTTVRHLDGEHSIDGTPINGSIPSSFGHAMGIGTNAASARQPLNKSTSTPLPSDKTTAKEGGDRPAMSSLPDRTMIPNLPSSLVPGGANYTHISNGTHIIINCSQQESYMSDNVGTMQEELAEGLMKFKEILQMRYKSTRTPLLPWHVGRKLIPLEDIYMEPRIFSIDRSGKFENVCLKQLLAWSNSETRFLVEGEAGMGKTLLTTRLAHNWAEGKDELMQQFQLVLLVPLVDFQNDLESFLLENVLPSYFDRDTFNKVWGYWIKNQKDILFILDGYDELRKCDKSIIENLISGKDFPNSRVLVTSRPAALQCNVTKLVVKGFNEYQMVKFVERYFDGTGNNNSTAALISILERHTKYRKLAERPLFCVLLCMLYEADAAHRELPDRMTDILIKIMLSLLKWRNVKTKDSEKDVDGIPLEFQEAFDDFGKVCVQAIKEDQHRFGSEDIKCVANFTELYKLGFLYLEEMVDVVNIRIFYKPVHHIFIEYFAALYIANHVRKCWLGCSQCWKSCSLLEREDSEVLVFTAGLLGPQAYRLFDFMRFPKLRKLPESKLLLLLKEARAHDHNKKVLANLLDRDPGVITTNESEIEGWSHLLPEKFSTMKTLEIVWRIKSNHPDQESSFVEASPDLLTSFFNAINKNTSIQRLVFRTKQDGANFTDEKLKVFFSAVHKSFTKKGLKTLEFKDMKIELNHYLRDAFNNALHTSLPAQPSFSELRLVHLKTFLSNKDLTTICTVLSSCAPQLETLKLHGLELGHEGFTSLASLLRMRNTLHHLYLSMNESLLVNAFDSANDRDYAPQVMSSQYSQNRLRRNAAKKSQDAFMQHSRGRPTDEEASPTSNFPYEDSSEDELTQTDSSTAAPAPSQPTPSSQRLFSELSFLFNTNNDDGVYKVPQARHYWFIKGSEMHLPLPLCMESEHESVFHYLFSALPYTQLRTLSLEQPGFYLTTADLVCLGDAIMSSPHLKTLDLQNLRRAKSYIPILVSLGQSRSLETVNLSSDRVVVKDPALQLACCALQHNTVLTKLSLANWQFVLQEKHASIRHVKAVLNSWRVRDLNLHHCSVKFNAHNSMAELIFSPPIITNIPSPQDQEFTTVTSLNIAQVELVDTGSHRGPQLLPALWNFNKLLQVDLSASPSKPTTVGDSECLQAFRLISQLPLLQDLSLKHWKFKLSESICSELGDVLSQCSYLKELRLDNASEEGIPDVLGSCSTSLLHMLVSSLPSLQYLSICYYSFGNKKFNEEMAKWLATCFRYHWKQWRIKIQVTGVSPSTLRALKFGLTQSLCILMELSTTPPIHTLQLYKPVLPSTCLTSLMRPRRSVTGS